MNSILNSDTDMLFPLRAIPQLSDLRGTEWKNLIERLSDAKTDQAQKIAFTHMVVKQAGCSSCNADSFRAMRGCTQCSRMVIKRFKGSDAELIKVYQESLKEVTEYFTKRSQQ